jgi:hypothetical protein
MRKRGGGGEEKSGMPRGLAGDFLDYSMHIHRNGLRADRIIPFGERDMIRYIEATASFL